MKNPSSVGYIYGRIIYFHRRVSKDFTKKGSMESLEDLYLLNTNM